MRQKTFIREPLASWLASRKKVCMMLVLIPAQKTVNRPWCYLQLVSSREWGQTRTVL